MAFNSIVIEGGDQVGKGDVTHYLTEKFIRDNVKGYKLSFPIYSSPFGYIVRKTLENNFTNVPKVESLIGTEREIELKMICYAINRLEALESILRRFENKDIYFLLDRSTYSIALTISYGLEGIKSIKKDQINKFIEKGLSFENLFIDTLNMKECVIHLASDFGKKGWRKTRSDGDLYEKKEIQEVADDVYERLSKKVGKGWSRVYTKINGEFRDREEIYKEVDEIITNLNLRKSRAAIEPIYDISEVAKDVYGVDVTKCKVFKKYFRNIKIDDNDNNKETYKMAYKMGDYIVDNSKKVIFKNKYVKENVRELLDQYPEMFLLLEYYYNKDFVNTVKEGIYD